MVNKENKEAGLCRYDFKMLKSTVFKTLVQMSTNNFGSPIKECVQVLLDTGYINILTFGTSITHTIKRWKLTRVIIKVIIKTEGLNMWERFDRKQTFFYLWDSAVSSDF